MAKFIVALFLAAVVGCAVAQVAVIPGSRDITGGYLDHYTGQYSSALSGRVYNTAGVVAAPAVVHAAAPALVHAAPAAIVSAPAIVGTTHHIATHHVAAQPLLAAWRR